MEAQQLDSFLKKLDTDGHLLESIPNKIVWLSGAPGAGHISAKDSSTGRANLRSEEKSDENRISGTASGTQTSESVTAMLASTKRKLRRKPAA